MLWKWGCFDFNPRVVDEQFVFDILTNLLSGVRAEVLRVYASNSNIDRRFLWRHVIEITFSWRGPDVIMGDFNSIIEHSEASGGSSVPSEVKEFDHAIREADLIELSV